jgi:hypothetical protein
MKSFLFVLGGLLFFFLVGCVSPPPSNENELYAPTLQTQSTSAEPNRAGDAVMYCVDGTSEENLSCFTAAFNTCKKSLGLFWKTQDGYPLLIETLGTDTTSGNCRVRISAADNESSFFGQSTSCSVPAEEVTFSLDALSSSTCEGSFFATLSKT